MRSLYSRLSTSVLLVFFLLFSTTTTTLATNEEGLAFLKANKEKPGVIELPSGLQYKVLNAGDGAHHPNVGTPCKCHYKGTLTDGTQFDSSYDRGEPTTFAPNQVIAGWTEAMQLMVEGDKWELYIPSELGYGEQGSPPKIPGGAVLVFQMEIIEIQGNDKVPALKCNAETKDKCNEKETSYIAKIAEWAEEKKAKEVERLQKLSADATKLKDDLRDWMKRRLHILKQVVKPTTAKEEEL